MPRKLDLAITYLLPIMKLHLENPDKDLGLSHVYYGVGMTGVEEGFRAVEINLQQSI